MFKHVLALGHMLRMISRSHATDPKQDLPREAHVVWVRHYTCVYQLYLEQALRRNILSQEHLGHQLGKQKLSEHGADDLSFRDLQNQAPKNMNTL